jgi:uncharacterized protein (DUF1501 family)
MAGDTGKSKKRRGKFIDLTRACARLMIGEEGADCGMLEFNGWDTHNNQSARLAKQLGELDQGLQSLKTGLGKQWEDTVVIIASEFGRTAKENDTGGTDHGTGGAMFIGGGAIRSQIFIEGWHHSVQ